MCFLVRCTELRVSTTPRLFWTLFWADGMGAYLIFSFTWGDKRFGERWAEPDSSNRMWHFELVWIRSGDLAWLPLFARDVSINLPRIDFCEDSKLLELIGRFTNVYNGCKWIPRLFRDNHFLYQYNCEFLYFIVRLRFLFASYILHTLHALHVLYVSHTLYILYVLHPLHTLYSFVHLVCLV